MITVLDQQAVSTTVAIHEPFAAHDQWTSLSDLGDQFCRRDRKLRVIGKLEKLLV